jgi:uncharacterized protein YndB with AHSA1/START domain
VSSRVLVALRVNAPRAKAFEVFVRDIGAWWQHNGLFRTARTPGTLAFEGLPEPAPDRRSPLQRAIPSTEEQSPSGEGSHSAWGPDGPVSHSPPDTGVLVETATDGERFEIGRVSVWAPPERLVFSWRQSGFPPDLTTEVEVRFDAISDDVTRVSVEHRGFHQVPDDSAARHGFPDAALQMRLAEWWHALLEGYGRLL